MNERIKLLAEQALEEFKAENKYATIIVPNPLKEKFAELIVRECVIQCEREWIRHGTDSIHNQAIHGCINSIKKHFGVKE